MRSPAVWLDAYLARLGLPDPGEPCAAALAALHRAQIERVAYENIDIQLGRPQGIDPAESVQRILARRGGYCYNLNGAFGALLTALGYRVTRHLGAVHGPDHAPHPDEYGNHMALTVDLDGELWMIDAGLGTAHHEPMRLTEGEHGDGPFTFRLDRFTPEPTAPAAVAVAAATAPDPAYWRFTQDPVLASGSFLAMDFSLAPVGWTAFLAHHVELSTWPSSPFVKTVQVLRRDATGADVIVGCVLKRIEGTDRRTERELTGPAEWFEAATDLFGLDLSAIGPADRERLWRRIRTAHEIRLAEAAAAAEPTAPTPADP